MEADGEAIGETDARTAKKNWDAGKAERYKIYVEMKRK